MKNAENVRSCLQRDSTECEGDAGAQSAVQPGNEETAGRSQKLLEAILYRDNLNRAYKRIKANKGAPGNRQSLNSSCHCMNRSFRKEAMATGQKEVRRMPSSRFGDMRMKGMNGQYSSI